MIRIAVLMLGLITVSAQAQPRPSVLLWNLNQNSAVIGHNLNETRSIASITKLMTAITSLEQDSNLDRKIPIAAGSHLPPGLHTRRDIMAAMLVRSDNAAADSLARDYPGGTDGFVRAMNLHARRLQMMNTTFTDASGLSSQNTATVYDVMTLVIASAQYPFIVETSVKKQVLFETNLGQRIRKVEIKNTNQPLLFEFDEIIVSKTGFTRRAGWCLALMVEKQKQRFVVVILGAETKDQRLQLAREIVYNQLNDIQVDQRRSIETAWWRRFWPWGQ